MNKKWLMVLMLGGIFTTGAVAQEKVATGKKVTSERPVSTDRKPFEEKLKPKTDADGDGKISKDEADKAPKGKLKENFATIDTNKDNYLDKEEMKAFRKKQKADKEALKQQ